jgi:predicted metal-dependent hydrolase
VPDEASFGVSDGVSLADQMLGDGQPFHAHEVLEALWKTRPAAERDLWQGLAQIAVGVTHALRGNASGAVTLLRRGADRLDGYSGPTYGMSDVAGSARALADRISRDGIAPAERYSIRLTRST